MTNEKSFRGPTSLSMTFPLSPTRGTRLSILTDSRALLTRLDSVLEADPQGVLGGLGNLIAARGWEAVGDVPRAAAAIRRTESANAPDVYYTAQLLEKGRIATLAGDRDLAIRSYRRYLVLRRDADPALQPQVEAIRKELQRLEAQASR